MTPAITLTSPLPADELLFDSLRASSGLSVLGDMQLSLLSARHDLKPQALLGKPVCVSLALRGDTKRHFHGYVTHFGMGRPRGRLHGYQARVRPWLWFLSRTSDCRIFQDQSVPEIVKAVFADHGIADFDFKLFRSYRKWVYCVQYRESDFNFIARLLEHEVIVQVDGAIKPGGLERLNRADHGFTFEGAPLSPAKVSWQSEGRLRFALKGEVPGQIAYFCESVGLQVEAMKRLRVGRVSISQLASGQWRYLLPQERF